MIDLWIGCLYNIQGSSPLEWTSRRLLLKKEDREPQAKMAGLRSVKGDADMRILNGVHILAGFYQETDQQPSAK